jgi:hypothetical protein
MPIPLLKDERGHLHTALDDIESFVYVLWYHVLRYRPLAMDMAEIQDKLKNVFQKWTVGTATKRAKGGDGKLSFFHGSIFLRAEIADSFPEVLADMLEDLRDMFGSYYALKPRSRRGGNPDQLSRWQQERVDALSRVSNPPALIKDIFDLYLMDETVDMWPRDDSADDNLATIIEAAPLEPSPSFLSGLNATTSSKRRWGGDSERTAGLGAVSLSSKVPRNSIAQSTPRSKSEA